ncbi:MAG: hypothetical protein GY762_12895 [Proteobacteria bacterium]|nr:hypothetical protein [Pseudomonadota bacterium]
MQRIFRAIIFLAVIALLLGASCDESGTDGVDVPATNLDCESNWESAGGSYSSGVLWQTVTITFTVAEDYVGDEYAYMVGAAISAGDEVKDPEIPVLVGQSLFDAGPLIPGETFTFTTDQFDRLPMISESPCGGYYYFGASIYYGEMSFPTNMEWTVFSDARYQVGGDAIVVELGEMQPTR